MGQKKFYNKVKEERKKENKKINHEKSHVIQMDNSTRLTKQMYQIARMY